MQIYRLGQKLRENDLKFGSVIGLAPNQPVYKILTVKTLIQAIPNQHSSLSKILDQLASNFQFEEIAELLNDYHR